VKEAPQRLRLLPLADERVEALLDCGKRALLGGESVEQRRFERSLRHLAEHGMNDVLKRDLRCQQFHLLSPLLKILGRFERGTTGGNT
jgi:hypothetical protein